MKRINKLFFLKPLRSYLKKEHFGVKLHLITGSVISVYIVQVADLYDNLRQGNFFTILVMILITICPIVVDFISYLKKNQHLIQVKLNKIQTLFDDLENLADSQVSNLIIFRLNRELKIFKVLLQEEGVSLEYFSKFQNKLIELENICLINLLKEGNEQKNNAAILNLEKEIKYLDSIKSGQVILDSFQNYEYVREIFSRILCKVMRVNDQYITLSSLGFWTRQPFLAGDGCDGFIKKNKDEINNGKIIKRIISVDENLLKSSREIELLDFEAYKQFEVDLKIKNLDTNAYVKYKLKDLKQQKKDLEDLVKKFNRAGSFANNNYENTILTLFCCLKPAMIEQLRPYLATLIILHSNNKQIMLVQTTGMATAPNTNANIEFGFYELKHAIPITDINRNDVKEIIKMLNNKEKYSYIDTKGTQNKSIDVYTFLKNYEEIFSKIRVIDMKVQNCNGIFDTMGLMQELGLKPVDF